MSSRLFVLAFALFGTLAIASIQQRGAPAPPHNPTASDTETTSSGELKITPVTHASLMLEFSGKTIHVDPTGDYSRMNKPADLILITDIHGDHMSAPSVAQLKKAGTIVVAPTEVQKTVTEARVINNGQTQTVNVAGTNIQIEAVPAYNLTRGPQPGQLYHTKGRGNGYILTLGGKRVYMSGDTECVPEIKALRNIDIAFLPMNLPFTQTAAEAAECIKAFRPKVFYPYHYRGTDLAPLSAGLQGQTGIELRLRNWY
jgi:L-ascorbate metabolism protein UlaG (beta-lactamase superfamily)